MHNKFKKDSFQLNFQNCYFVRENFELFYTICNKTTTTESKYYSKNMFVILRKRSLSYFYFLVKYRFTRIF